MNWIIFSHECSGKSFFCNKNNMKIGKFDLVDWDIIKATPSAKFQNEILLIDLLIQISNEDNKIYLTNIQPPEFILHCRDYYSNIKFGIVHLEKKNLEENIKNRHHINYDSNYITDSHTNLKIIIDSKNINFPIFKNYEEFETYLYPPPSKLNLTKRIIRL